MAALVRGSVPLGSCGCCWIAEELPAEERLLTGGEVPAVDDLPPGAELATEGAVAVAFD